MSSAAVAALRRYLRCLWKLSLGKPQQRRRSFARSGNEKEGDDRMLSFYTDERHVGFHTVKFLVLFFRTVSCLPQRPCFSHLVPKPGTDMISKSTNESLRQKIAKQWWNVPNVRHRPWNYSSKNARLSECRCANLLTTQIRFWGFRWPEAKFCTLFWDV